MKVLVTGCNGQLGSQLINMLKIGKSELGDIPKTLTNAQIAGIDAEQLDISNLDAIKRFIKNLNPDVVINPAAYTNVDACESNEELAFKVNA